MSEAKMDEKHTLYDKHRSMEIRQKIPLAHLNGKIPSWELYLHINHYLYLYRTHIQIILVK